MAHNRKLRTVIFADIQGYTALMQENEPHALELLNTFKSTLDEIVPLHKGEIIQFFGDGALLAFDSTTDGVECGIRMQRIFGEQQLPVRVGMHLGEVVFKNNNLFGDGVNIASRIESIGVPGTVLVSKTVWDQVRNKTEFELESLGDFQFKNVAEPIEVFAVKNEGLFVPDRRKLTGKIQARPFSWQKAAGFLLLFGLVVALGIGLVLSWGTSPTIPEDIRKKRLAVMVFENQTFKPEYNAFGKMISDWVTNGLMETGEANIINAVNLTPKESSEEPEGRITEILLAAGVNLMLKGRYYLIDDRLAVQANLINAQTGEVIHALDRMEGDKDDLSGLLRSLTQEVLGYWAVKDRNRFLQNPPAYDAYQEWLEADRFTISDPNQAARHYQQAFVLDSTFFDPLISLFQLYGSIGRFQERDSLYAFLEERSAQFTRWEKIRFNEVRAVRNKDWEAVAQSAERRYQMDSTDHKALELAMSAYNCINFPTRSLELSKSFDFSYLTRDLYDIIWLETNQIFPNLQLGNFEEVDRIASQYDYAKIPDATAAMHLKALVHLDSFDRLDRFFHFYQSEKVYNTSGRPTPFYTIHAMLCDELLIVGNQDILQQYVGMMEQQLPADPFHPSYFDIKGFVHFHSGRYLEAAQAWEKHQIRKEDWPGWLWQTLEYDRLSKIGHCYAKIGMQEQADLYRERLIQTTSGLDQYYGARILAAGGQLDEAIQSLRRALQEGFHFYGPVRFTFDPFLMPLYQQAEFQELVKPR